MAGRLEDIIGWRALVQQLRGWATRIEDEGVASEMLSLADTIEYLMELK